MAAREVYRYIDKRGDSIIFKFDRKLILKSTGSLYHLLPLDQAR